MPDPTNAERAAWAEAALAAFFDASGLHRDPPEEAIGDLITDLLHLARRETCDLNQLLRCVARDYNAEIAEGRERLAYPENSP